MKEFVDSMDWTRAIAINHAALARIVAGLVALMELASAGRLSRPLHRVILRVLRPAESAVRRLIVIAARDLDAGPAASRPMPRGIAFAAAGGGRVSFQLFDPRKRFDSAARGNTFAGVQPRIHVFGARPLAPVFQPRAVEAPAATPDTTIDAARLNRRLAAISSALDDLPRQARRMVRWRARRDRMQGPALRSPFRPGPPPGHRKAPEQEVDWVLSECHALARDVLRDDTS